MQGKQKKRTHELQTVDQTARKVQMGLSSLWLNSSSLMFHKAKWLWQSSAHQTLFSGRDVLQLLTRLGILTTVEAHVMLVNTRQEAGKEGKNNPTQLEQSWCVYAKGFMVLSSFPLKGVCVFFVWLDDNVSNVWTVSPLKEYNTPESTGWTVGSTFFCPF